MVLGVVRQVAALLFFLSISSSAYSEPWAAPNDLRLRHDLQLLSDAGVLPSILQAWPISWGDISQHLPSSGFDSSLPVHVNRALQRVSYRFREESRAGNMQEYAGLTLGRPTDINGFAENHTEEATLNAGIKWLGDRFAFNLRGTAVSDPSDDRSYRLDGSYVAGIWGNWAISAGVVDRFWGPGWDGSLILSHNARPLPMVSVERNASRAYENKWLRWMGPWKFQFLIGRFESDRVIENALFMGMRWSMRPTAKVEIGLSRTAQWGGEGRPADISTLGKLLIGRDNREDDGVTLDNEPGNQLAGFDLRWQSPFYGRYPYAFYGQMIGEDEAGGMPSRYIGLFGLEHWGGFGNGGASYRTYLEVANTIAAFNESTKHHNAAYNHGIYRSGYRYYGRTLGHSIETAGEVVTFGVVLVGERGDTWQLKLRSGDLNRKAGVTHPITPVGVSYAELSLKHERQLDAAGVLGLELQAVDSEYYDENWKLAGQVSWRTSW